MLVAQASGVIDVPDQSWDGGADRADLVHSLGHWSALVGQRDRLTVSGVWPVWRRTADFCHDGTFGGSLAWVLRTALVCEVDTRPTPTATYCAAEFSTISVSAAGGLRRTDRSPVR
jgi:hypothetical protein